MSPARHRQHHEPAARLLGEQALGAQLEQRLAHRGDADSQLGGQLVQPDVLARGVGAVEDPVTDVTARQSSESCGRAANSGTVTVRSDTRRAVAC